MTEVRASRRACPVCGGTSAEEIALLDLVLPDGHPLADPAVGPFAVASCAACGTGFTDVQVEQSAFDAYYASDAKYADEGATVPGGDASAVHAATPWAVANNRVTADRLLSLIPAGADVLDLGCAVGTLLVELRSRGVERAVGLDPSPRSAAVGAQLGVDVRTGTFADLPAGLGTFDAVTMLGVLEHLWDVPVALRSIQGLLRPGGIVYLDVPDAARYCHAGFVPYEDFNTEHTNHFSLRTLDLLFSRHGFAPVWCEAGFAAADEGVPAIPAAAGAWRWTGEAGPSATVSRDGQLVDELQRFARWSATKLVELDRYLDARLGDGADACVWGVGELLYKLLAGRALGGRTLVAAVDGNPARQGKRIAGVEVGAPSTLVAGEAPIVVTAGHAERSICRAAAALGIADRLVVLPFDRAGEAVGAG